MADVLIVSSNEDREIALALQRALVGVGLTADVAAEPHVTDVGCWMFVMTDLAIQRAAFVEAAAQVGRMRRAVIARFTYRPLPLSLSGAPTFGLIGWDGDPRAADLDGLISTTERLAFSFRERRPPPPAAAAFAPPLRGPSQEPDSFNALSEETAAWKSIQHSDDPDALRDFLDHFGPDSPFADLAQLKLSQLETRRPPPPDPGADPRWTGWTVRAPSAAPAPPLEPPPPRAPPPAPRAREFMAAPPAPPLRDNHPPSGRRQPAYADDPFDVPPPLPPPPRPRRAAAAPPPKEAGNGRGQLIAVFALIAVLVGGGVALFSGGDPPPAEDGGPAAEFRGAQPVDDQAALSETDPTEEASIPGATSLEEAALAPDVSNAPRAGPAREPRSPPPPRPAPVRETARDPARERVQERAQEPARTTPPPRRETLAAAAPPPATRAPAAPAAEEISTAQLEAMSRTPASTIEPRRPETSTASPSSTASTAPPPVLPGEVRWAQRPSMRRLQALYPARAQDAGIEGTVSLRCRIGADLRAQCAIASETPPRRGFGEAALRAAEDFRASPTLSNGETAVGGTANITLRFRSSS